MGNIASSICGSKIRKMDFKNKFFSVFDRQNGFYMRSGVFGEDGKETEEDPFMTAYPELIDIGIMGHCFHGKRGLCLQAGVQCYQNGFDKNMRNMTLPEYKSIIDQSKGKVFQAALGGRGDPNKHEDFKDIVKYTYESAIVPNYTTSGLNLKDEEVEATKKYCGAVAVSYYRSEYTFDAINRFVSAGVRTNIHYVLGNNTIDEAIQLLKTDGAPKGINAVVFLMHKPVGLGKEDNVLSPNDDRVKEFFNLIDNNKFSHKVGFDSCTVPGILNFCKSIDVKSLDTCEGARFSCYCSADMKLVPCSFDQDMKWAVDLKTHTIEEAWNSQQFNDFRNHLRNSCSSCSMRESCMGGCPIKPEIALCNLKEKEQK